MIKKYKIWIMMILSWLPVAGATWYIVSEYFPTQLETVKSRDGKVIKRIETRRGYRMTSWYNAQGKVVETTRERVGGGRIWCKGFYPSGAMSDLTTYQKDHIAQVKLFFPNGKLAAAGQDQYHWGPGTFEIYEPGGAPVLKINYLDCVRDGGFTSKYPDGRVIGDGIIKKGNPWSGTFSRRSLVNPYVEGTTEPDFLDEYDNGILKKSTVLAVPFDCHWPLAEMAPASGRPSPLDGGSFD